MLHDTDVDREIKAQFEQDRRAFKSLSPRAQRWAVRIAVAGLYARKVFARTFRTILSVVDGIFQTVFIQPYVFLAKGARALANGLVNQAKKGVGTISSVAQEILPASAGKIVAWERRTVAKITETWEKTKEGLQRAAEKAGRFAEYHGALGLYRATAWVLNPRTPSGRPLLGNEVLNRFAGGIAAVGLFTLLSYQLTKLAVVAKIWHIQFAQSFIGDPSPFYLKALKQAAFHPLLATGLTAVKFLTLPVIAASRQAMKLTPFTQGIAFYYNARLGGEDNGEKARPKKKISAAIHRFVDHIFEKASPEFYRARIKHYEGRETAVPSPQPKVPEEAPAPLQVNEPLSDIRVQGSFNQESLDKARKPEIPPSAEKNTLKNQDGPPAHPPL